MKNKYLYAGIAIICALALGFIVYKKEIIGPHTIVQEHSDAHEESFKHDDHDDHDEADDHDEDDHDEDEHDEDEHDEDEHDEDEHDEDEHDEEIVQLSDVELKEFGIVLETAKAGTLEQYIELPGEIVLNSDRIAHVVPRVAGIVTKVKATVGDQIKVEKLLAVLESRELADAKASYLAAIEHEKLAQSNFNREKRLWEKKVTSEQEYLDARQALAEAQITRNSTEQQLHALGFTDEELKEFPKMHKDAAYTRFEIRSPLSGTIIEKHITLGENINSEEDVFTIADLSTVWVNLNIYQKDIVNIRKGQIVNIEIGHGIPSVKGKIAWIGPQLDEETRTAKARVELPNPNGDLRPGFFVTAKVAIGSFPAKLVVPKSALQTFENKTVVFVLTGDGLEPKPVELGRQTGTMVEILSGLELGQKYAAKGSFTLKAQLSKGAFDDGHNH